MKDTSDINLNHSEYKIPSQTEVFKREMNIESRMCTSQNMLKDVVYKKFNNKSFIYIQTVSSQTSHCVEDYLSILEELSHFNLK